MLKYVRPRRAVYLSVVLVVLLAVWLAAGGAVSGHDLSKDRFFRESTQPFSHRENLIGSSELHDGNDGENCPEGFFPCPEVDPLADLEDLNSKGNVPVVNPQQDGLATDISDSTGNENVEGAGLPPATEPFISEGNSPDLSESDTASGSVLHTGSVEEAPSVPSLPAAVSDVPISVPTASPPYSLGKPQYRQFRIRVMVRNSGEMESQNIRLQVPVISKLNSLYQVVESESFSLEPDEIEEGKLGGRCAHFNLSSLPVGESAMVAITYRLKILPITTNFTTCYNGDNTLGEAVYLQPAANIESDHPEIIAKAEQLTSEVKDDLGKVRAIYKFVQQYMRYDPNAPCRNGGALVALRQKVGVCEDYAALFVALCRAVNIPARQVNGYADPKGTGGRWDQLSQPFSLKGFRHSWAEFYLGGIGWLPVDPTMNISAVDYKYFGSLPSASHITQNYLDQSMRIKFQGGRLEATWEEELI